MTYKGSYGYIHVATGYVITVRDLKLGLRLELGLDWFRVRV